MKDCRVCAEPFEPQRMGQIVCGIACAKRLPVVTRKADKAKLKTRSQWLKEAQQAFNAWIRARDAGLGCISCGTHDGKENAGHYLSTGARPELRFEPDNVHLQCERCNTSLHGNLIPYRRALIERIGSARVEWLEGPHVPNKPRIDDLREIRDAYRTKLKELQQ
jgi:hypothetical protein